MKQARLGVRRLGAALLSIALDRDESGARPPHSKELTIIDIRLKIALLIAGTKNSRGSFEPSYGNQ